jgi:hypothetical protein
LLTTANYANKETYLIKGNAYYSDTVTTTPVFFKIYLATCVGSKAYVFSIIEEAADSALTGSITGLDSATHTYASLIKISTSKS